MSYTTHIAKIIPTFENEDARTGGVAQVVECLLCKLESLSSTPSHTPPPKRKKYERGCLSWENLITGLKTI
jgi:hypothetical protein